MDSISGVVNTVLALQQQKSAEQVNLAVLTKAKDLQKQQGQQTIQLLNSVPAPHQSGIDVYA